MPQYAFEKVDNPSVTTELFYHMSDAPSVGKTVTVDGIKWRRVFTLPQASIDTRCDPHSLNDFVKVTNKKGTVGSMWDRSRDLSLQRREKDGADTVQQGYLKDYTRRRRGTIHPEQRRQESAAKLAKVGIKVDYGSDD